MPTDNPGDTPRTDAEAVNIHVTGPENLQVSMTPHKEGPWTRANFARVLERELAQRQTYIDELTKLDGNWTDKWGACRVCGGEIPYGHRSNCDLYKMEQTITEQSRTICRLLSAPIPPPPAP